MAGSEWRSSEVLAWSRHDGPGDPPVPPSRWLVGGVGGGLTVAFLGVLSSDTLCPDHRMWVDVLATFAVVSAAVAVTQVVRNQASAGLFTLIASAMGVAIGLLEAVHEPTRGRLIVAVFALVALGSGIVSFRLHQLAAWDRRLADAHRVASDGAVTEEPAPDRAGPPHRDDSEDPAERRAGTSGRVGRS